VEVSSTPGDRIVQLDFELHRGLWITGRVTEAESAKPVKAKLHYLPFLANRYAQDLPGFGGNANGFTYFSHLQHRYQTEADGMFRLVGLPGRAIVGVDGYGEFCVGVGADEIEGLDREGKFATYRNPLLPGRHWPHAMKEIHPEEGKQEVQVDFVLKRGARQTVRVVDADGNPLAGAHIGGAGPSAGFALDKHHEAVFDVHGLGPRDTRKLFIQHREKNLAAVATVDMQAERPATMEVRLTPGATIRGQLVDRDGEPMRSTGIEARTQLGEYVVRLESIMTDEDGAFQIDAVPGPADYELRLIRTESRLPDEARRLTIEAGETRDLGMIQVVR
jgi:hypothetical protein